MQFQFRSDYDDRSGRIVNPFPSKFWRKRPCFPLRLSLNDLSGRLASVFTALDFRLLSNSESTASCSIRFSLRRITSGAFISIKRFKRLFRMITYDKDRSDQMWQPPPIEWNQRSQLGGITGTTRITMCSGLLTFREALNDSKT